MIHVRVTERISPIEVGCVVYLILQKEGLNIKRLNLTAVIVSLKHEMNVPTVWIDIWCACSVQGLSTMFLRIPQLIPISLKTHGDHLPLIHHMKEEELAPVLPLRRDWKHDWTFSRFVTKHGPK
ncbi:hypothetical protein CEXT_714441 [Caerostris extrusa]|uniref:Uncharacterized protein n=1 Tax=Caerostris extrusa TaxID=172846 RepID=A0AAV4YFW1_CAEEX|nr:hypothetical protein CEXT_714441 [Caerostris extrusa]